MQITAGFVLSRRFGWYWDTAFVLISLCFLSALTGLYMLLYSLEMVIRAESFDARVNPKREPVVVATHAVNQLYELKVPGLKADTERMFCKALLEFPNLTESYWLKGSPSKWQSMGGVGRSDFVKCKERLTRVGALERTNPKAGNSPHRVSDRRILEHRASHPTPPL